MSSRTDHRKQREELLKISDSGCSRSVNNLSVKSYNYHPTLSSLTGSCSVQDSTLSTASSSDEELSDSDDEQRSVISYEERDESLFDIRDTETDVEVIANDNILNSNAFRQVGIDASKSAKSKGSLKPRGKFSFKKKLTIFSKGEVDSFAQSESTRLKIDRYAIRSNRDKYCIEGMEDIDAFSFNSDMQESRSSKPEIKINAKGSGNNNDESSDFDTLTQWFSTNFDFDIMDQSKNISDYLSGQNFDLGIVKTLDEAIEATTNESNNLYSDFVGTLEENLASLQSAVDSVQQSLFTLNDAIGSNEGTADSEAAESNKEKQEILSESECKEDFEIGLRQCCSSGSQDRGDELRTNSSKGDNILTSKSAMLVNPRKLQFSVSRLRKRIKKKFYRRKSTSETRDQ